MRAFTILLGASAAAFSDASPIDEVELVQKSIAVTASGSNETASAAAAMEMLQKLSGLVHMIDHDITAADEPSKLEDLFHCTRTAGIDTADGIIEVTNDIVELPVTCFQQDCSAKDNFNHQVNPALAMAGGVETMLGMMTAIGNVDSTCVSRETRTIAAVQDANLKFPSWMSWAMKPFGLMSEAYDLTALAVSKDSERFHFGICGSVASFTGASLNLMESMFSVKANEEYKALGDASDSASWACAASLTEMVKTLPSVVQIACDYESCKAGEPVALAKALKPSVVG